MVVFLIIQFLILAAFFAVWVWDPSFFHIGYLLYHTYPVFFFLTTILFRKKVVNNSYMRKILGIVIPMSFWMIGVVYIYYFSIGS